MMITEGKYSPARQYVRIKESKKCILRLIQLDKEVIEAFFVETMDYSRGGVSIIFGGEKISTGNRYFVYIEALNIIRKAAEIVWLKQLNGNYRAGLKWI